MSGLIKDISRKFCQDFLAAHNLLIGLCLSELRISRIASNMAKIVDTAQRHQEFADLFVRHQRRVYGYILTIVANVNDADDLFSETSLILWKRVEDFDFDADFTAWACGVARNVIRNWRVKQGRDRHLFSDELLARLGSEREEASDWLDGVRDALRGCLAQLKPAQRQFVQRCYGGKETVAAIAAAEGRSADAAYQQLSRLRKQLMECIQRNMSGEERL